ncbi:unnamed protein product [Cyprideis torosa]|uniref:Uncharacterized protein n=1 Tax=Cyprideis torosa TaxID=163714 RepID=A0A7R8W301_9CRUS|nr:unnamed protein product [Cyprideis torosa]CAG0882518.1 unnamed protein product [Cyprideis torosa]
MFGTTIALALLFGNEAAPVSIKSHVHEDVGKEKEVIRKTVSTQTGDQTVSTQTEDRSREQNQDDILAMMTEERPDEGYWEILANRRGQTIEKLQLENESLRSERETMKKEYSEMLALVKEARDLGRLMEEAIERSDEEDADSGSNKPEEEA